MHGHLNFKFVFIVVNNNTMHLRHLVQGAFLTNCTV